MFQRSKRLVRVWIKRLLASDLPSTEKASVVVGAVLFPELEACTEPVGEACIESVLLDDVVIGAEAVETVISAVVCGKASTGTNNELNPIILAYVTMLKEAMVKKVSFTARWKNLR